VTPPRAIIVVTLDCVRPDHLGCYGYRGVDTPNIDRMAQEGTVFEQAIAQAPNTWVSHACIFTGCNPYKHGVRTPFTRLSSHVTTLAEALSQYGFATAAFPAHTLVGPGLGFDRGFDFFDLDASELMQNSEVNGNKFYRSWDAIWASVSAWTIQQSGRFFVWVHYMGTHELPIELLPLPVNFRKQYSSMGQYYDGKISWADKECVGIILSFLEEAGLAAGSILVVLSDHGDALVGGPDPFGRPVHNAELTDDVMRIPLVIQAPSHLPANMHVATQVRSIDIMPTLLDLADVPIPESVEGQSLVPYCKGSTQMMHGSTTSYAYIENVPRHWLGIRTSDWKLILTDEPLPAAQTPPAVPESTIDVFRAAVGSALHVLRTHKEYVHPSVHAAMRTVYCGVRWVYRLLRGRKSPEPRSQPMLETEATPLPFETKVLEQGRVSALYDLRNDPDEQQDVAAQHPEIVEALRAQLANMIEGSTTELHDISETDRAEIERRLGALGYL